jgi:hypothetical protein
LLIILIGCGSGSKSIVSDKPEVKAATLRDVEVILENIATYSELTKGLQKASILYKNLKKFIKEERSDTVLKQSCEEGLINIFYNPNELLKDGNSIDIKTSIEYVNCSLDNVLFDGTIKYRYTNHSSYMECLNDFATTKNGEKLTLLKNSFIKIENAEDGDYDITTINLAGRLTGISKNIEFGGKNLIYHTKDDNVSSWLYPVSGREMVGDGVFFTIDPNYDSSKTPFTEDKNGNILPGGLFKYLDEKKHKIEIEVTNKNEITLRIDMNNNNIFESFETKIIY